MSDTKAAIAAFDKAHPGELSEAQKAKRAELVEAHRAAEFRKLGKLRTDRAVRAIEGVAKLANKGRYSYNEGQVKLLKDHFKSALDACFAAFEGKKTAGGLEL